jgi:hypothetical protein
MMFQAVRNERRRGLVVGSLDSDPEDPKFKSETETAKKTKKTVAIHHNKSLGVNAKKNTTHQPL